MNYQNNDWVYVEWPTNNLGDELFELATREKTTRDTREPSPLTKEETWMDFHMVLHWAL